MQVKIYDSNAECVLEGKLISQTFFPEPDGSIQLHLFRIVIPASTIQEDILSSREKATFVCPGKTRT